MRKRRGSGGLATALIIAAGLIAASIGVVTAVSSGSPAVSPAEGAGAGSKDGHGRRRHHLPPLPEAPAPAFKIGKPIFLKHVRQIARVAPVLEQVDARERPRASAGSVSPVYTQTTDGTTNLVLVVGKPREDARGHVWVKVRLPSLPNGLTAWVPRSSLGGITLVHTHVVVSLEQLTLTLFRGGKRIFAARIGAGQEQWPTPKGEFYIRDKLTDFDNPFYGPIAFGTSARSAVLTDWPDGGFVGIHGTNEPDLIPGRISHGCIRLRNEDITHLARLMPVGTPVTIR
jgi:lipoprotein-anchoring transpeptidase ErfK/SrfK